MCDVTVAEGRRSHEAAWTHLVLPAYLALGLQMIESVERPALLWLL